MVVAGYPVIYFANYDYMRLFNGDFIRRSNAGHYLGVYEKIITVDTELNALSCPFHKNIFMCLSSQ